jgi:hypothetical protein
VFSRHGPIVLLARLQFILHDSTRLFGLSEQLPARLRSKSNLHILHIAFFIQFTLTNEHTGVAAGSQQVRSITESPVPLRLNRPTRTSLGVGRMKRSASGDK